MCCVVAWLVRVLGVVVVLVGSALLRSWLVDSSLLRGWLVWFEFVSCFAGCFEFVAWSAAWFEHVPWCRFVVSVVQVRLSQEQTKPSRGRFMRILARCIRRRGVRNKSPEGCVPSCSPVGPNDSGVGGGRTQSRDGALPERLGGFPRIPKEPQEGYKRP